MTAPIDAVLLDFAGTLFSDRALRDVHLQQLRYVGAAAGVTATDQELRAAYCDGMGVAYRTVASQAYYLHRTLFAGAFLAMAGALGSEIDEGTADAAVDLQYKATIDAAVLRPGCRDALVGLRELGVHLQIVSNIDDEQLDGLVDRLGLAALIDASTSSESAGSCKPDPAIYHHALAKAGGTPAAALFVGDSLRHDIEGPAAVGMRTAWLVVDAKGDAGHPPPDFVIEELGELPAIVRETRWR